MSLAISVQRLWKKYDNFEAVKGIDFEVRTGEVFGLLGPNGAGKTTTVEILEGIRHRTSGDVRVLGYDPDRQKPSSKTASASASRPPTSPTKFRVHEALNSSPRSTPAWPTPTSC